MITSLRFRMHSVPLSGCARCLNSGKSGGQADGLQNGDTSPPWKGRNQEKGNQKSKLLPLVISIFLCQVGRSGEPMCVGKVSATR